MNKIKNLLLYLFHPICSMDHEPNQTPKISKARLHLLSSKYQIIQTQTKSINNLYVQITEHFKILYVLLFTNHLKDKFSIDKFYINTSMLFYEMKQKIKKFCSSRFWNEQLDATFYKFAIEKTTKIIKLAERMEILKSTREQIQELESKISISQNNLNKEIETIEKEIETIQKEISDKAKSIDRKKNHNTNIDKSLETILNLMNILFVYFFVNGGDVNNFHKGDKKVWKKIKKIFDNQLNFETKSNEIKEIFDNQLNFETKSNEISKTFIFFDETMLRTILPLTYNKYIEDVDNITINKIETLSNQISDFDKTSLDVGLCWSMSILDLNNQVYENLILLDIKKLIEEKRERDKESNDPKLIQHNQSLEKNMKIINSRISMMKDLNEVFPEEIKKLIKESEENENIKQKSYENIKISENMDPEEYKKIFEELMETIRSQIRRAEYLKEIFEKLLLNQETFNKSEHTHKNKFRNKLAIENFLSINKLESDYKLKNMQMSLLLKEITLEEFKALKQIGVRLCD